MSNRRFVAAGVRQRHQQAAALCAAPPNVGLHVHFLVLLALLGITLLLSSSAAFGADIGFHGIAAQGGAVSPSNWDTGYEVGAHVDLGEMTSGLFLQPSVMYWKASGTDSFLGIAFDRDMSNLAIGADVLWYPSGERRGWYVGGGAYLNRLEYDIYGGRVSDNRVGANANGGYDFSVGSSSAFVGGRYHAVSGFNTVQFGVGFRFGS